MSNSAISNGCNCGRFSCKKCKGRKISSFGVDTSIASGTLFTTVKGSGTASENINVTFETLSNSILAKVPSALTGPFLETENPLEQTVLGDVTFMGTVTAAELVTAPSSLKVGSSILNQAGAFIDQSSELDDSKGFLLRRDYDATGSLPLETESLGPEQQIDLVDLTGTRMTLPAMFQLSGGAGPGVNAYQSQLGLFIYTELDDFNLVAHIDSFTGTVTNTITDFNSGPVQAVAITAITLGATTTVTAPGHAYITGDHVGFNFITGTTELNGFVSRSMVVSGDDLILSDIDSSLFTPYVSGGEAGGLLVFIPLDNLNRVNPSQIYFSTFTNGTAFDVDGDGAGVWNDIIGYNIDSVEEVAINEPLSTARYVDSGTITENRDGSINKPYISISEALADITDNSASKSYALRIAPGDYNEGSLTLKPFISLNGYGSAEDNLIVTDLDANEAGQYRIKNINIVGNVTIDFSSVESSLLLVENGALVGNFLFDGSGAGDDTVLLNSTTILGTVTASNTTFVATDINFDGVVNIVATGGVPAPNGDIATTRFLGRRMTGASVNVSGPMQHSVELSNTVVDGVFNADGANTTVELFVDSYPNSIFFSNGAKGILKNEADSARQGYKNDSTGLVRGGEITQGSLNTQIDIAAGVGTIYDYSDPASPEPFPVTFGPFTDIDITNVGTERFTYFMIDRDDNVIQLKPGEFSFIQRRDFIPLGTVTHTTGVFEAYFRNTIETRETHAQLMDLMEGLGVIKVRGLTIEPNADLTFAKDAGILMNPGAGNITNARAENAASINAESPQVFGRLLGIQDVTTASGVTTLDPSNYDDGSGSPVNVPAANNATIQYIFQFPLSTQAVSVMYGQTVYANLDEAVSLAASDSVAIPEFIRQNGLLLARIALIDGATDLTDPLDAVFLPGAKFGVDITGGSGGSGGGGGDVFGPASSIADEIPTFADPTGKVLQASSDISALTGDLSRSGTNLDLRLVRNGTGKVQFGASAILGEFGAANIGGTIFSIATPLAGDSKVQFENNGSIQGSVGYHNFQDAIALLGPDGFAGMWVESSGQISIGAGQEIDPDFSVLINGKLFSSTLPMGLPTLTTGDEASVTNRARMLHYNSILNRVRYNDGSGFKSLASLDDIPPQYHNEDNEENFTGSFETFGKFTMDGTVQKIESYAHQYSKTGLVSVTIDCQIIYDTSLGDPGGHSGEVYFSGSDTQSSSDDYIITASEDMAVPNEPEVPVLIQIRRSSGGDITSSKSLRVKVSAK